MYNMIDVMVGKSLLKPSENFNRVVALVSIRLQVKDKSYCSFKDNSYLIIFGKEYILFLIN